MLNIVILVVSLFFAAMLGWFLTFSKEDRAFMGFGLAMNLVNAWDSSLKIMGV